MAADGQTRAFCERVVDVLFDFFDRAIVDQRALCRARFEAWCRLELPDGVGQLRGKRVVDAIVHEEPVRAHARLSAVAVLGGDRALDRAVQIRIVEDDERRVAAKLQRIFLIVPAHCTISAADGRGTCKRGFGPSRSRSVRRRCRRRGQ